MKQNNFSESLQKEISSKDWQFGYERRMTYQMMYLFYSGYHTGLNTLFGTDFRDYIFRVKDGNNAQYCWKSNEDKNLSVIRNMLIKESASLSSKLSRLITETYERVNKDIAKLPEDYSHMSANEIIDNYAWFKKCQEEISLPIWLLFTPLETILVDVLKTKLAEALSEEEVNQTMEALSRPTDIIPLDHYLSSLARISLAPKEEQETMLDECSKEFAHLGMFDLHYPETERKYHEKKLSEFTEESAKAFLNEVKEKYTQRKSDVEKIKKRFSEKPDLSALISFFALYANYKEWKNFYREDLSYKASFLFKTIAKKLGLTPEEAGFMTFEEIKDAFLTQKIPSRTELHKRINDSAFVFLDDTLCIVTDTQDLERIDSLISQKFSEEIKGVPAYKGVARGRAKIVISSNDFGKVEKGDILVTSTTRPDFIKIMELAAGFVTNEGGMLSHAAILAREMKKPCIIGTKVATKVLKDGDSVEVDAEKGIIKIINE